MQDILGNVVNSVSGRAVIPLSSSLTSSLDILTWLAIIFLLGIFCSIISKKLKISNIILLILTGFLIGKLTYDGVPITKGITDSTLFLISIGTLALVMVIFDSSSKFKLREFDTFSSRAMSLTVVFLIFNLIFLSITTYLLFYTDIINIISLFEYKTGYEYIPAALCLIFSVMMSGTDPAVVLTMLKQNTNRVVELLKIESLLNTPLIVLFPFIIIDILFNLMAGEGINGTVTMHLVAQIMPFLNSFVSGIGSGIVIGLLVFKYMRKHYSENLSQLAILTSAILTYILAERLGGNGVLAVTTLGLFFGNITVKQKETLQEFSSILSASLGILVFFLIGLIIGEKIPLTIEFFVKSLLLFIIYILIRFISVVFTFKNSTFTPKHVDFTLKELLFLSLNVPKGIAIAVLAFILSAHTLLGTDYLIPGVQIILNLTLAFIVYSIALSTIVIKFSNYFLDKPKIEE